MEFRIFTKNRVWFLQNCRVQELGRINIGNTKMSKVTEEKLNQMDLKLKTQEKQLQVVKGIINRNSGYAKSQAEATEKRLTQEIADLKKEIKAAKAK